MSFIGELLGTLVLVLLGDGVVAAVCLKKTKAEGSGWIAITLGWGLAVAVPVYMVGFLSGAHLNPAVTIALALTGAFPWGQVLPYIVAQMLGAMLGATLVYLHYYPHWQETKDSATILGCFSTAPAIRHTWSNFLGEAIGTAVLVMTVMSLGPNKLSSGFGPLIVGLVVMAVGFGLGGTTGYAINPARDLGPRLIHALLPISNKGGSDWSYAWIPVLAPILGGALGAALYQILLTSM
ncbi:MIP/aquaporin family protein [Streptococcus pseudoporcinus]|uniref:Glycerol uptake facilitator protein 2 n=1 Tax=Streptococcus pseudoporcinus TaxID=361101 RepID=A0A4U9XJI7_9STRE|nr:MIP/aquaporin family protein [Streptococcus pseudoporcinus]VTS12942.1 glycerol uptake facilitator protein 2 [Streptococcus pseudoporcinus]VUC66067.1 glycerol uptake facilitator protein 2 [Streptococcus pseudoporcinus]VUC96994.1 glycerol uptake facilitator protein 2 [Streptococcus pseudoporcinus]VUC97382.1 glycerol uptake facilitator protein 2 [Streptococcus pseudoporcinus]